MKKTKFWLLGMILALIYSCSDDFETKEQSPQGLEISEAQSYFEKNATDLAPLTFSNPLSRSANLDMSELVPEWSKAIESENEDYLIAEVPLRSLSNVICIENIAKDNEFLDKEEIMCCQRRLVIARQKDKDETDMFVATLVPDGKLVGEENASFTGRVFYSELNGNFRKAVKYKDGQVQDTLLITKGYGFAIHTQKESPLDYSTLVFQEGSTLRSSTYSSSEGGGGGWDPGWGGGGTGGGSIGGGGTGGGTGTGGGGTGTGGGGYDPAYIHGRETVDQMIVNLRNADAAVYSLKEINKLETITNVSSIGLTVPGIITSCYNYMQGINLDKVAMRFGKTIGWTGVVISGIQTIIAISEGKYDSETVVNAVATACGLLGLLCVGWPAVLFGVTGCVIGCVSSAMSLARSLLIEIPMEDGGSIYVYIPANMDITA